MLGLDPEGVAHPLYGGAPGVGQIPRAARRVAGAQGTVEEVWIGFGRGNPGLMVGRHFAEAEE
jgi:hypothetical protein